MLKLNEDIIRHIVINLDLIDILNFSNTCNYINKSLDNIFFQELANKLYSKEFWLKAYSRPKISSKPLGSIKKELLRIKYFQDFVKLHNFKE